MGYGSYTAQDWSKLKASKNLTSNSSVKEIYKATSCNPKFDPKYIGTRECFDSAEHPETTPIVIGLDVTASMGYLAKKVATESLNDLIMKLFSTGIIRDPSLMCAAYGDYMDNSPLQVTQFESDIRIAEQLLELYFEDGGQCEVALPCLWEFLAYHTNIDAIKKRGQKGFLFTIGDQAEIRDNYVQETIERVVNDKILMATRENMLQKVQKNFYVFHIMIGGQPKNNAGILDGHKICISESDIDFLPEIIISTIMLQNGKSQSDILNNWSEIKQPVVQNILNQLFLSDKNNNIKL